MHQVNVFISHSWSYSGHYDTIADWIFNKAWKSDNVPIKFINTSVPRDNPIHNAPNDQMLKNAIFERLQISHVIVVPTGMYSNYSKWIKKELEGARAHGKKILAVNPWGQERKSSIVQGIANETVGWNKESVVRGVWRLRK